MPSKKTGILKMLIHEEILGVKVLVHEELNAP